MEVITNSVLRHLRTGPFFYILNKRLMVADIKKTVLKLYIYTLCKKTTKNL